MKPTPIFTTAARKHQVHNHNLAIADRDRSKPAPLKAHTKPLVSICAGLGIGIIMTSLAENRQIQAAATALDIANTRIITATTPAVGGRQTLAQTDACIAENSTQEAQVALALSQAQLAQTHTNLQKFQSEYNRHKMLASQGKATPRQLQTAKVAYDLAQLQKSSALQDCNKSKHS